MPWPRLGRAEARHELKRGSTLKLKLVRIRTNVIPGVATLVEQSYARNCDQ